MYEKTSPPLPFPARLLTVAYVGDHQHISATSCFNLDTTPDATGFGKYVNYYTSPYGITLSAALKVDYKGQGFNNAPSTTNGLNSHGAALFVCPPYLFPSYAAAPSPPTRARHTHLCAA